MGGRTLTVGTTGALRRSDLVMWDRQTQFWWQQFTGEALVGRYTGARLRALDSQTASFAQFKARYPRGAVLSRDTGFDRPYGENPYVGYDAPGERPFLFDGGPDARLPPKERVVAVFAPRATLVVAFSRLRRDPVATARGGRFTDAETGSTWDITGRRSPGRCACGACVRCATTSSSASPSRRSCRGRGSCDETPRTSLA